MRAVIVIVTVSLTLLRGSKILGLLNRSKLSRSLDVLGTLNILPRNLTSILHRSTILRHRSTILRSILRSILRLLI